MVTGNAINQGTAAAGKVLQGAGAGVAPTFSTPTYPSASGTSRTILVSDATNNVYSTETWAVPGTSGNVLTSNGTNWTSAAAGSGTLLTVTKNLTSAQIKAIHATPIEIIAAPGSGKGIVIVSVAAKLNYGGSNNFTAAASQTISLYWNNGTTLASAAVANAFITQANNRFSVTPTTTVLSNSAAGILDNVNIAAFNPIVTEIAGNAAGDNTIDIIAAYWIVTF